MRSQDERARVRVQAGLQGGCIRRGLQAVIQMAGGVAFGIGEHGGCGGMTI